MTTNALKMSREEKLRRYMRDGQLVVRPLKIKRVLFFTQCTHGAGGQQIAVLKSARPEDQQWVADKLAQTLGEALQEAESRPYAVFGLVLDSLRQVLEEVAYDDDSMKRNRITQAFGDALEAVLQRIDPAVKDAERLEEPMKKSQLFSEFCDFLAQKGIDLEDDKPDQPEAPAPAQAQKAAPAPEPAKTPEQPADPQTGTVDKARGLPDDAFQRQLSQFTQGSPTSQDQYAMIFQAFGAVGTGMKAIVDHLAQQGAALAQLMKNQGTIQPGNVGQNPIDEATLTKMKLDQSMGPLLGWMNPVEPQQQNSGPNFGA